MTSSDRDSAEHRPKYSTSSQQPAQPQRRDLWFSPVEQVLQSGFGWLGSRKDLLGSSTAPEEPKPDAGVALQHFPSGVPQVLGNTTSNPFSRAG